MKPLVTVLLPVYNGGKYIAEAIDSVLAQTFADFELLIVDDASTDNTITIIQNYRDERIRLVRNEKNLGISATLNKGIELATCELIARMDADDICYHNRLQVQYDYSQSDPDCCLLSAWARVIDINKHPLRTEKYKSSYYYYNLTFECWIYHPTVMYKRTGVINCGGYRSLYAEDYDLFWKMSTRYKIATIEEVLLDYRVTSQSLHQVLKKKEYDEAMERFVERNIRYYTGSAFKIKKEQLECLRYNFLPLHKKNSAILVFLTLVKLKKITLAILETDNVNLDSENLREAYYHKHRYIRRYFYENFSPLNRFLLKLLLVPGRHLTEVKI